MIRLLWYHINTERLYFAEKLEQEMDNYYRRIRDLREDRDLTQQDIADYLEMKQSQYSRYERGIRDIPTDILIKLARYYKTSTDYILGLTDNPVQMWK